MYMIYVYIGWVSLGCALSRLVDARGVGGEGAAGARQGVQRRLALLYEVEARRRKGLSRRDKPLNKFRWGVQSLRRSVYNNSAGAYQLKNKPQCVNLIMSIVPQHINLRVIPRISA